MYRCEDFPSFSYSNPLSALQKAGSKKQVSLGKTFSFLLLFVVPPHTLCVSVEIDLACKTQFYNKFAFSVERLNFFFVLLDFPPPSPIWFVSLLLHLTVPMSSLHNIRCSLLFGGHFGFLNGDRSSDLRTELFPAPILGTILLISRKFCSLLQA